MYYHEQELIRKYGLVEPKNHKFLRYIPKVVDLILYHDDVEGFKKYQANYKDHFFSNTILKATLVHGAIKCFNYFVEDKSGKYFFENLFRTPESPEMGTRCFYSYARNSAMLKAIDETCEKLFPGKTPLDFLTEEKQIENCIARFGIDGRIKLADKLFDKLDSPLFMVNNTHIFEAAYRNKAYSFCEFYLKKIEETKFVKPFILSMFSESDKATDVKYANFFDKFTRKQYNKDDKVQQNINDFLVRNIKKGTIPTLFQELLITYCVYNKNKEFLNMYFQAKPIDKHHIYLAKANPSKFYDLIQDPYCCIKNNSTYLLNMHNNALKVFHYNENTIQKWMSLTREFDNPEMQTSISSLFFLGEKYCIADTLKFFDSYVDWEYKDKKGNNFTHYIVNLFIKNEQQFSDYGHFTDMFKAAKFLLEHKSEYLFMNNNDGISSGQLLSETIKNGTHYNKLKNYYINNKPINVDDLRNIESLFTTIDYNILNNELAEKDKNSKRLKI